MNTDIAISHLSQSYGSKTALEDISLVIPQGMFGLLGRNGAGKTTLMKTLATLLVPKSGRFSVYGVDFSQSMRLREMIGYLPQDFSMYPSMTVREAMDYLGVLSGLNREIRTKRTSELLEKVNLSDQANTKIKALSGGMKRRLGIAQALLHDPQVIIADEPTAGLDPEERVRFRKLFMELSKSKTVLLSTHIVSDIEEACENLAILDRGKTCFVGSVSSLLSLTGSDNMEQAYISCIHGMEVGSC